MEILANSKDVSNDWITEVSQDSAKYFIDILEQDNANTPNVLATLAKYCIEHNEMAVCVIIMKYFRIMGHELPNRFKEMAAQNEIFDIYCRQLLFHMVMLSAN